ncbi:MAG: hypothetical protein A2W98_05735 [Bacteroidetes bacterium GWF2_33_38]|nr:MAG: hypothetical protein A2W98_05735 [Bacteroidetes bacterium GWF2_33_38]
MWSDGVLRDDEEFGSSGFSALPAGSNMDGEYSGLGFNTSFWSASEWLNINRIYRGLINNNSEIYRNSYYFYSYGHSVRCTEDIDSLIPLSITHFDYNAN